MSSLATRGTQRPHSPSCCVLTTRLCLLYSSSPDRGRRRLPSTSPCSPWRGTVTSSMLRLTCWLTRCTDSGAVEHCNTGGLTVQSRYVAAYSPLCCELTNGLPSNAGLTRRIDDGRDEHCDVVVELDVRSRYVTTSLTFCAVLKNHHLPVASPPRLPPPILVSKPRAFRPPRRKLPSKRALEAEAVDMVRGDGLRGGVKVNETVSPSRHLGRRTEARP